MANNVRTEAQERAFYDPNAKIFDEATRTRVMAELEDPNIPADKKAILQQRLNSTNEMYTNIGRQNAQPNTYSSNSGGVTRSDIISTVNPQSPHREDLREALGNANANVGLDVGKPKEDPPPPVPEIEPGTLVNQPEYGNTQQTNAIGAPVGQDYGQNRLTGVDIDRAQHGLTDEQLAKQDKETRQKNLDTLNKVTEGNSQISKESKTVWDSLRGSGGGPVKMMAQAYGGGLGGYLMAASQILRDDVASFQELGMRHVSRNNQQQLTRKATDDIMRSFTDAQNTVAAEGFKNSNDYLKNEWQNWSKQERDLFKAEFDARIQKLADEYQIDAERLLNQAKLSQEQQITLSALDAQQALAYLEVAFQAEQNGLDRDQKDKLLYAAYQYDMSKIGENKRLEMQLARYMKELGVEYLGFDILKSVASSLGSGVGQGLARTLAP